MSSKNNKERVKSIEEVRNYLIQKVNDQDVVQSLAPNQKSVYNCVCELRRLGMSVTMSNFVHIQDNNQEVDKQLANYAELIYQIDVYLKHICHPYKSWFKNNIPWVVSTLIALSSVVTNILRMML